MAGAFGFVAGVALDVFGEAVEFRPVDGEPRAGRAVVQRGGLDALGLMVEETRLSVASADAADMGRGVVVVEGAEYEVLSVDRQNGGRATLRLRGPLS